jgi:CheY-like chemotaxis protein
LPGTNCYFADFRGPSSSYTKLESGNVFQGPCIMVNSSHLVLCVDDEVVGLRIRKILLERAGYEVLTASDGNSGLELFAANPVDAVVLDYAMPGMHGGEVARKMRQTKPEVPILLLSAYVGLPAEVSSLVDIYMTKGQGAPTLLQHLDSLLSVPAASQST